MLKEYKVLTYEQYRDFSKTITKMCDLVDLFGGVNKSLLEKAKADEKAAKSPAVAVQSEEEKNKIY